MKWFILTLGIVCNASASCLVKVAITPPRRFPSLADPFSAITNWPLLLGLLLYVGAFLFYAAALARLPLNVAHPIMTSGAVAAVAVLSVVAFRESFHWTLGFGIAVVIIGMIFITSTA